MCVCACVCMCVCVCVCVCVCQDQQEKACVGDVCKGVWKAAGSKVVQV